MKKIGQKCCTFEKINQQLRLFTVEPWNYNKSHYNEVPTISNLTIFFSLAKVINSNSMEQNPANEPQYLEIPGSVKTTQKSKLIIYHK